MISIRAKSSFQRGKPGLGRIFNVLTGQEAIELHQKLKVHILALRRLAVRIAHVVTVQINTYINKDSRLAKGTFTSLNYKIAGSGNHSLPIVADSSGLILEVEDRSQLEQAQKKFFCKRFLGGLPLR